MDCDCNELTKKERKVRRKLDTVRGKSKWS